MDRAREDDLDRAPLDALRARHPAAWAEVSEALLAALATGRAEKVAAWLGGVRREADHWRARVAKAGGAERVTAAAFPHLLRARLAHLALEQTTLALAARETEGPVRLSLLGGSLVQRLLFARGLERKAASLRALRLLWPLVGKDRRILMPLLQPKGIYCFYTRELTAALARLAAGRPVLELAAGDGTLARLLAAEGVQVTATDDGSWSHAVTVPPAVERLEARAALRRHPAPVVLCSWPPPGNAFERAVFEAPGVELYVMIGSRHRFAAGDWQAYERQGTFDWAEDEGLSRLVWPPEADPAVLVFRRRASAAGRGA